MIDIHSHILPGLDDGPADMETALIMCRMAARDGIKVIAATPHVLNDVFAPEKDLIIRTTDELNNAVRKEGIPLTIVPGSEHHLTHDIIERIDQKLVLTYADRGNYILIEPSFLSPHPRFREIIFDIMLRNLVPVIAHVERLPYFFNQYELMEDLVRQGALLQVTSGSILGKFGTQADVFSNELIRRKLVAAVSSDAHGTQSRRPLLSKAFKKVEQDFGEETARHLFVSGPGKIIDYEEA